MNRRSKLTRADRQKRAVKREHRAEGAEERIAEREARERWLRIPRATRVRFQQIGQIYEWATRNPVVSQVVCEKCELAQPYVTDEDELLSGGKWPTSDDGITLCMSAHFLGIPCDGEYAVSVERFSGS
jgi:hypothetical protein